MNRFGLLVVAVAGIAATSNALADAADGQGYVNAMITATQADDDRNAFNERGGLRLGAGIALSENWNLQGFISRSDLKGPSPQEISGVGVDLQRVFKRGETISPYLFLSLGQMDVDLANGPSSDGSMYGVGAGLQMDLFGDSPVSLNLEYRYRTDNALPSDMSDHVLGIGVHIPFGSRPASMPVDGDADGDGVRDSMDQCRGTPMGRVVDGAGCELDADNDGVADGADQCANTVAGAIVDTRGCALDSDNDGVPNGVDQCSDTRAGAQVDARGCEPDSDADGVLDGLDACPDTTAGARVDVRGCEITDEITLPSVQFETNSATLQAGAQSSLDDAVVTLNRYPELVVEVAGHTDSDGAEAYNLELSQNRAQTVLEYLVEAGIDASRLSAQGYGESEPIATNATAIGKAQNRRVVLRLLAQ